MNLQDLFRSYTKAIHSHRKAQAYCASRALDFNTIDIGYKSQRAADKWARGCIIFPLKDVLGNIVSLYGRSIAGKQHFYQKNRTGLYPLYPGRDTKTLILAESIIDAASLQSSGLLNIENGAVLSLFGTNGLTPEHLEAIKRLTQLQEIILILDADHAGRAATIQITKTLASIKPNLSISRVELPEGEDVNSLIVAHDKAQELFNELIQNRIVMHTAPEAEKPSPGKSVLNTTNPNNLIYITSNANYFIKGGIRYGANDFDHMKVTLVIENERHKKSRQKLDLFEDKQVEKVSRSAAEKLNLRADLIELDLQLLTDELEQYRERLHVQPKEEKKTQVPQSDRAKCIEFLSKAKLPERINTLIGQAGISGEEVNRLLLFVVASSFKMPDTLHALIQGASGSGKTRLLRVISELMPAEEVKRYTRVTDGSFYNQAEFFFKNKLLCFEDIDGLKEDALLAVRELQSNEILITSTSIKDEHGKIRGGERIVRGPIASLACTTKAQVFEDNISRCFVVAVDESKAQSLRIIQYQNDKAAGVVDPKKESEVKTFLQHCIRLLEPLEVINPFANKIHLPQDAHKIRRLNELYQSFVRQITLINQFQRKRDQQGRLITDKEDLQFACDILFESIVLKVDELDGSLRQFFEKLKKYVKTKGKNYEFTQREIRLHFRVSKSGMQRFMNNLLSMEYLHQNGFANRGYRYKISFWDDNQALRQRLKDGLKNQLVKL